MSALRRLDVRLFASYALVALVGGLAFIIAARVLAPPFFDDHFRMMNHGMNGLGTSGMASVHDALSSALNTALPLGLLASLVAAAILSAFVARRIVRPIAAVQHATRRLALGHYDERVPLPRETELAGLAADVNQLAATLESTERRRAQLISDVAHELRTPLTSIQGYMEGIADGVFEPTADIINAVTDEVTRLQRLASDLSSLSKLDEDAFELHVETVDVAQLAARSALMLRSQFADKGVDLEVQAPSPLDVTGDPDRLTQILTNLLSNALTYTPPGGRVVVTCHAEPEGALVTIADTGIGLAPDELDHVFERFYRAADTDRPPGGSGIGLSIARSIARAHHGELTVTSPGRHQGATFVLRLPSPLH